jgi:hypothetical protein
MEFIMTTIATPTQLAAAAVLPSTLSTLRDTSYPTVRWGWVGRWEGFALLDNVLLLGHGPQGSPDWVSRHGFVSAHDLTVADAAAIREGIEALAALDEPFVENYCRVYPGSPRPHQPARAGVESVIKQVVLGGDARELLHSEHARIRAAVEYYKNRADWERGALPISHEQAYRRGYTLFPPAPAPVEETVEAAAARLRCSPREAARRREQRAAAKRRTIRI